MSWDRPLSNERLTAAVSHLKNVGGIYDTLAQYIEMMERPWCVDADVGESAEYMKNTRDLQDCKDENDA